MYFSIMYQKTKRELFNSSSCLLPSCFFLRLPLLYYCHARYLQLCVWRPVPIFLLRLPHTATREWPKQWWHDAVQLWQTETGIPALSRRFTWKHTASSVALLQLILAGMGQGLGTTWTGNQSDRLCRRGGEGKASQVISQSQAGTHRQT